MNELGVESPHARATPGYEGFARRLYATVAENDPTRPIIENDWIEPDPARVFCSPLLTAHWYGRLADSYLRDLSAKAAHWGAGERPLFVSEFGDWGLPDLDRADQDFWAYGHQLATVIDGSDWPGDPAAFIEGTQRYQGLADRLQIEIFRSTPGVVGWCLTELTDVPQEFNGLFDLHRKPKSSAVEEIARACQTILPLIRRTSWTLATGAPLEDEVLVVNDGPALEHCRLRVRLGEREFVTEIGRLDAHSVTGPISVRVETPRTSGTAELELAVESERLQRGCNRYAIHVVSDAPTTQRQRVTTIGDERLQRALRAAGAYPVDGDADMLVVGEGALDKDSAAEVAERLRHGRDVLLLAQPASAQGYLPFPAAMTDLRTEWGSTPFIFTTDAPGLPSIPTRTVLTTEILEATPNVVWNAGAGASFAAETVVGVLKPPPDSVVGTIVGRRAVGDGSLTVCQLPLTEGAATGRALGVALLGELIGYAGGTRPVSRRGLDR